MDKRFDDHAFLVRDDNKITLTVNINEYRTIMDNIKGNYTQIKPFGDSLFEQGEPQAKVIVERYEAEVTAYNIELGKSAAEVGADTNSEAA